VFVSKFSADGATLIYSTYIGGSDSDVGYGIAVDAGGCAHVAGYTGSRDFPTTAGAYDRVIGGIADTFALKLAADGTALAYSTFLGGSTGAESARGVAVATSGDAQYEPSSGTGTLTCQSWGTKMATFDRTARITDRTELKCRLLRSDDVPLYQKAINFYVDGTFTIARPTNAAGYASYPYHTVPDGAGAGPKTILSEWPGNGGYAAISKTATLTALKAIAYIWVLPKRVPYHGVANLYAYFRRLYDYRKQEGRTVTFPVDGTWVADVVTETGAEAGVARYYYQTTEAPGVYTIRCEFAGDAWVDAGYGEADLTIY